MVPRPQPAVRGGATPRRAQLRVLHRIPQGDGARVAVAAITEAGGTILPYGDGSETRSFQYIDDLIEGIVRLMPSGDHGPVNLGNPDEYTVLQLAEMVRALTHSTSPMVFRPLPRNVPKQRQPETSLARSLFGWQPHVAVREGLARTVAYLRRSEKAGSERGDAVVFARKSA